jgi:hypothetical protein
MIDRQPTWSWRCHVGWPSRLGIFPGFFLRSALQSVVTQPPVEIGWMGVCSGGVHEHCARVVRAQVLEHKTGSQLTISATISASLLICSSTSAPSSLQIFRCCSQFLIGRCARLFRSTHSLKIHSVASSMGMVRPSTPFPHFESASGFLPPHDPSPFDCRTARSGS